MPTIAELFHRESGRVLATLIRLLGDFKKLAENANAGAAFAAALVQCVAKRSSTHNLPHAWLVNADATRRSRSRLGGICSFSRQTPGGWNQIDVG